MRFVAVAHVSEERQSNCQQDTLLDTDRDNCCRGADGKVKLARALAANIEQSFHVDHPRRDREYDAGQHTSRQVLKRTREE